VLLVETLRRIGYSIIELLLTPLQYGIPNSRLRYYLLARRGDDHFPMDDRVWRHIPGKPENPSVKVSPLKDFLDSSATESAVPDKILAKWGRLFDIVKPSSTRSCCFTRGYHHLVERAGSILQEEEDLDVSLPLFLIIRRSSVPQTTKVFNEFLAAQAGGNSDALDILRPLRLRYFTPTELLRIFAFDEASFIWPVTISTKTKYRLIGNSVNVRVVRELITYLL